MIYRLKRVYYTANDVIQVHENVLKGEDVEQLLDVISFLLLKDKKDQECTQLGVKVRISLKEMIE